MACCRPKAKVGFQPDFSSRPLTLKFYARHDYDKIEDYEASSVDFFAREIEKRLKYDPRDRFLVPVTENQIYGWLERSAFKYEDEQDREILYRPRRADETMHTLMKVMNDMRRHRLYGKKR